MCTEYSLCNWCLGSKETALTQVNNYISLRSSNNKCPIRPLFALFFFPISSGGGKSGRTKQARERRAVHFSRGLNAIVTHIIHILLRAEKYMVQVYGPHSPHMCGVRENVAGKGGKKNLLCLRVWEQVSSPPLW